MKKHLKRYTSFKNYIDFLRRQPRHMQHVYAFVFSGAVTSLIAAIILYTDYGFWHEKYSSDALKKEVASTTQVMPESPVEMLSKFFDEAKVQLRGINVSSSSLFEGKETYSKETIEE